MLTAASVWEWRLQNDVYDDDDDDDVRRLVLEEWTVVAGDDSGYPCGEMAAALSRGPHPRVNLHQDVGIVHARCCRRLLRLLRSRSLRSRASASSREG